MSALFKLIQHPYRQTVTERYFDFSRAKPGTPAYRARLLVDFWHKERATGERLREFDMRAFQHFVEAHGESFAYYQGRMNVANFETANVMSLRYTHFGSRLKINAVRNLLGVHLGDFGSGAIVDAAARRCNLVRSTGVPLLLGIAVHALDPVPIRTSASFAVIPLAASGKAVSGLVTCSQPADELEQALC